MSFPFQFRTILVLLAFVAATALWACSTDKDREQEESEDYNAVNCDATVDSFNARCDELQLSDEAFREMVCVTYEDPGCLAWCMDFRQDCEAVLDCYDLRDCDVPAEDAGDDDTQ